MNKFWTLFNKKPWVSDVQVFWKHSGHVKKKGEIAPNKQYNYSFATSIPRVFSTRLKTCLLISSNFEIVACKLLQF